MRGPAIEPDEDAVDVVRGSPFGLGCFRPTLEQFREAKTAQCSETELEEIAAAYAVTVQGGFHNISG